jgi:lysophospholipid acyltransferase (LPLAT)-like uncharacterized protein
MGNLTFVTSNKKEKYHVIIEFNMSHVSTIIWPFKKEKYQVNFWLDVSHDIPVILILWHGEMLGNHWIWNKSFCPLYFKD